MSFLGPVGSLIPVKCASQLTSSGGRSVSFQDTLGKRKAFLGNVRAREWDVEIGLATPGELSGLQWLAENVNSPMVWYSPDAVVGNILPPAQAAFTPDVHNGLEGPLVEVEPGIVVKSAFPSASFVAFPRSGGEREPIPVVSETPVSASVWTRGSGGQLSLTWWDASGNSVSQEHSATVSGSTFQRVSLTAVPPSTAVGATLSLRGEQVAGPAVTLTDRLMPYSPGRGAHRVVAHGLADAVIRATENQQYQSLSFTVSEVG